MTMLSDILFSLRTVYDAHVHPIEKALLHKFCIKILIHRTDSRIHVMYRPDGRGFPLHTLRYSGSGLSLVLRLLMSLSTGS
jgi:hypothetical protein